MKQPTGLIVLPCVFVAVLVFCDQVSAVKTPTVSPSPSKTTDSHKPEEMKLAEQKAALMTQHATGTFEVKLTPQEPGENSTDKSLGRLSFEKQFHGDLEGTSRGQMLTGGDASSGSGGYVAMEKITGKLSGKSGTFILQHSGTMTRGTPHLIVSVVPDSGTGELEGITGSFNIIIAQGKHSYDFEYVLPNTR